MSIAARTIKRKIPSKLVLREMPPLNQTGEMGDQETQGILTNKFEGDERAELAFARAMIRNMESKRSMKMRSSSQGAVTHGDIKQAYQLEKKRRTSIPTKASHEESDNNKIGSSIARSHSAIATMVPEGGESCSACSAFAKKQSTARSHSSMASKCHEDRTRCGICNQYVHGRSTARDHSALVNTRHENEVRNKGTQHEESKNRKIESTTREGARKGFMEWSTVEFRSIKDTGPHRARHCPTQKGYSVTTEATKEKPISSKVEHKRKEVGKLEGEKPHVKGRMGKGTNATSTSLDNMPLPIKPDQSDRESSDDNLFSSDDELEEDQNTCSISGAQENIRGRLTMSGHKRKGDQTVHLDDPEVESDDNSWTRAMQQIQTPYKIRTFEMGFPTPIKTAPPAPRMNRTRYFGPKWNPEEKKDKEKWNPATRSNNYLPDHTSSHNDIDYNYTINEDGNQILRRWRSYKMDETAVTLCKVRRTVDQGIGRIVAREHRETSLQALRLLPRSMFAAWFALRNATSLRPIAPQVVKVTKATRYFGFVLDFLEDHDNQKLRRRVQNIEWNQAFQAMICHLHYYLLDQYLDWWTEDAKIMEGPHLVNQRQWPTAVLCGTQV
jgi:hypothetical protein